MSTIDYFALASGQLAKVNEAADEPLPIPDGIAAAHAFAVLALAEEQRTANLIAAYRLDYDSHDAINEPLLEQINIRLGLDGAA